ncbi:porin [Photobacterium rosenbergii]|uniref:porin n=1 Tax=Photobacterium rosenbergii TaxID=294936 RepID=UPI001C99B48F|nr:porin [Photobacterium rosenbergii]MBY5949041.1 porin [Photobacterium rosenbergii]
MKKTVVAAVIGSVVASASAMAAEVYKSDDLSVSVYGNLRARYETTDNGLMGADSTFTGEGTELGLSMTYFMDNNMYVNGDVLKEFNIIPENGDGFDDSEDFLKFGSVAIGGDFGEFRMGRMSAVQDTLAGQYDITWEYGGTANIKSDAAATDRLTNGIQYKIDVNNFTVMAQYHTGQEFDDLKFVGLPDKIEIDQAYAVGAAWNSDFGLGLSGTYTRSERTSRSENGGDKDTSWTLNATYEWQALSLAAMYSDYDFAGDEQTGVGAMARYDFPMGFGLYGVYDYVDYDTQNDKLNQYTIGADYWLTSQVVSYMEYADQDFDKSNAGQDDNAFTIGMRLYF